MIELLLGPAILASILYIIFLVGMISQSLLMAGITTAVFLIIAKMLGIITLDLRKSKK